MDLLELAERVEAASEPDREADALIAIALGFAGRSILTATPFTASLDAAMTLVPADHEWLVRDDEGGAFANVSRRDASNVTEPFVPGFPPTEEEFDRRGFAQGHRYARAATPALSLCAAALKARAASADTRRMAETGTGSGRSPSGAVPATPGDAPNDR